MENMLPHCPVPQRTSRPPPYGCVRETPAARHSGPHLADTSWFRHAATIVTCQPRDITPTSSVTALPLVIRTQVDLPVLHTGDPIKKKVQRGVEPA